ncbi:hypothetical protein K9N68_37235 (plasmid) [Kovacikia minuta CCNUW1]|uniref:hypothetical protein n=1 Tax=Kovacikia minuta TaxID=2931930 RepID=UPI001CCF3A28|nr:hypothetical protein [Kovacikia minuta]UBF29857.1 hypothetical protein K9N68_37235 [Kovacikia minuta CCNUW1]
MEGLTEGKIVHYVLCHHKSEGQVRPAIVTRVWRDGNGKPMENGSCQLTVFPDQSNDELGETMAVSSVYYDELGKPGTWHWISRA